MAAGRAILATRVGDNPHVIEDGVTGILANVGDVEGMAQALHQLRDPALRQRLGQAARVDYERRFTLDHMIRAYERLYTEVAAG